jgi:hypothetical protein
VYVAKVGNLKVTWSRALPAAPTVAGYDPRLQLCHPDDAADVIEKTVVADHPGIFNVAPASPLIEIRGRVSLSL